MKKIKLKENKCICENRTSPFNYFAWPTVTRLPDGNLAMVCSGYRLAHVCPFGKTVISYSLNDGKTWTKAAPVIDTPLDDRDGGIAVFGNGRVIVTSFNNSVEFQRMAIRDYAIPQGRKDVKMRTEYLNMLNAKKVEKEYMGSVYKISNDGGYGFGETKRLQISAPHGPCALPGGGLIYVGAPFNENQFNTAKRRGIVCCRLNENDGFDEIGFLANDSDNNWVEPYAFALSDTDIIVHIRVENAEKDIGTIYQTESHDGGKTFSPARPIGLERGFPSHIMRHSNGMMIASYGYRRKDMGERVMFSKDCGKTWIADYILCDDSKVWDLGYPSTVELSNGELMTVYYQYNEDVEACEIKACVWDLPEEL